MDIFLGWMRFRVNYKRESDFMNDRENAVLEKVFLCNRKVNVLDIIKKQILVFENDKTLRISKWDIFCFVFCPFVISFMIIMHLQYINPGNGTPMTI
jgi:hypothetical protein